MSEATTNDVTSPTPEISTQENAPQAVTEGATESAPESAPATPAGAPAEAPAPEPAPVAAPVASVVASPVVAPTAPGRLKLPHTANCLVCGRDNPHGLKLDFSVASNTGVVIAEFIGQKHHAGFEGLIHGGLISTVMDEAMTWAATWNIKRFCLCGELSVRFRQSVVVGQKIRIEALVDFSRPKLVEPSAKVFDEFNKLLVTATGKYVPVTGDQHGQFIRTFIDNPETRAAAELLGMRRHEETHE